MEKVKNFFRKVGTFCKNAALKVGSFCKSTFLKIKGWALAHKIAAIAIAAGSVVAITLAIVLPVSISAANRKKTQQEPAEPEHVHVFANEWSKNSEVHWHAATCGHDVKGDEAAHTFGAWTVNGEKHEHSCTVCGYKVSADHEWGEWHISASSNKIDERECSVCGKVESRAHEHNYVVDKFVWQAMPRGYNVDAYYSCSLTDDLHLNALVTPTEVERVDATDTADGHVKYHVEFTTPSGNKATEDKEFVLHRPDEHGFCLNCGEYAGETFSCEEAGAFSLYLGCPHAGDKLYFRCDLLSGHSLYLSDSDYALDSELTGYVKNGDLFSPAALAEEATINTGEDGYVYIVFEASFDRTVDDFLNFTRDHTENVYGLCLSDYAYSGKTQEVGTKFNINTTTSSSADARKVSSFRFPIEEYHHYYLELDADQCDQLDYGGTNGAARAWFVKDHVSTEVSLAEDAVTCGLYIGDGCTPEQIEFDDDIGQGYLYFNFYSAAAEGMNINVTIKDDHFVSEELGECAGDIMAVDLGTEVVLGEEGEGGHHILGTDEPQLFRIKSGFAEGHIYFIDANNIPADEINVLYWDKTSGKFNNVTRSGGNEEYFIAPDADKTNGTIYFKASPIGKVTDASITILLEAHPEDHSCTDDQGFCTKISGEYVGTTLELGVTAPDFAMGSVQYFRISKEDFADQHYFHIYCEELNLHSASIYINTYYKDSSTGTWKQLGVAPGYQSSNDDNYFYNYADVEDFNAIIDAACDPYFYVRILNIGSPIPTVTTFRVTNVI